MTDKKKISIAVSSLILASAFEALILLTQLSVQLSNILWGLQLILVLVALGISAKMLGNFGTSKKLKNQSRLILILASALALYAFIL